MRNGPEITRSRLAILPLIHRVREQRSSIAPRSLRMLLYIITLLFATPLHSSESKEKHCSHAYLPLRFYFDPFDAIVVAGVLLLASFSLFVTLQFADN